MRETDLEAMVIVAANTTALAVVRHMVSKVGRAGQAEHDFRRKGCSMCVKLGLASTHMCMYNSV